MGVRTFSKTLKSLFLGYVWMGSHHWAKGLPQFLYLKTVLVSELS